MKCREFLRHCDETLDARAVGPAPGLPPEFDAHAAGCPSCRAAHAGALLLGQAFAALAPPPPASAESLARLRGLAVPRASIPLRAPRRVPLSRIASAASILGLAAIGYSAMRRAPVETPTPPAAASPRPTPVRPLDAAFREATRATIDLARAVSAPAARIGREALDLDDASTPPGMAIEAKAEAQDQSADAPARLLEAVGERVQARVRPISGSARHAFSFLLAPADDPPPAPPAGRDTL